MINLIFVKDCVKISVLALYVVIFTINSIMVYMDPNSECLYLPTNAACLDSLAVKKMGGNYTVCMYYFYSAFANRTREYSLFSYSSLLPLFKISLLYLVCGVTVLQGKCKADFLPSL